MWDILPVYQKNDYKKRILGYVALSELFTQKSNNIEDVTPILNSKYQEKQFCESFGAVVEDVGNTSFDASLRLTEDNGTVHKYLIGIKTFMHNGSDQKVAQFKSDANEWNVKLGAIKEHTKGCSLIEINKAYESLYREVALKISIIRNKRISSSIENLKGFNVLGDDIVESVYHVLMTSTKQDVEPRVYVGEIDYDFIDINHIKVLGCTQKNTPGNFRFTDGIHEYKYTYADSQLYMNFHNSDIVKEIWKVKYLKNSSDIMPMIYDECYGRNNTLMKDGNITESYSWLLFNSKGEVERYSGLNAFYGVGSKLSIAKRKEKISSIISKHSQSFSSELKAEVKTLITRFLLEPASTKEQKFEKEIIRKNILELIKDEKDEVKQDFIKILYRPMDELYIPIPHSSCFHKSHPDFFAIGAGALDAKGKLLLHKEARSFKLMFEPSGDIVYSFITQDAGKAIESCESQSFLGNWILRKVFQLQEFEPLTKEHLEVIGINGIRLYRTSMDDYIHLLFINIDMDDLPNDYWGGTNE